MFHIYFFKIVCGLHRCACAAVLLEDNVVKSRFPATFALCDDVFVRTLGELIGLPTRSSKGFAY